MTMRLRRSGSWVVFAAAALIAVVAPYSTAWAWTPCVQVCGCSPNASPSGVYWSGSTARVSATFSAGPSSIKKVELWVKGVRRFHKTWTSNYPTSYKQCAPFSTTQFACYSTLTLEARMWLTNGAYYEDTDSSHKAKNRGYCIPNIDLSTLQRALAASNCFATAHHVTVCDYYNAGNIEDILIPMGTSFHASTHGDTTSFGDSWSEPGSGEDRYLDLGEIAAAVASKGANECQHNFVFLDSCYSAKDERLREAWNAVSYLGWNGWMSADITYRTFVQTLYSSLAAQKTLTAANDDARSETGLNHSQIFGDRYYKVHWVAPSV